MIQASDKTPQYSYSSLKQKKKKDKVFSFIPQKKWAKFFIGWQLVLEFCDSASIIGFSSCLFPSFLTIINWIKVQNCLAWWKLYVWMCCESDLTLSLASFQSVSSVLCSSLYRQGLGSPASWCTLCMRHISYPLFHPMSCHLAQCLHLLPCVFSTPSSVPLWHPACLLVSCVQGWGSHSRRQVAALHSCYGLCIF